MAFVTAFTGIFEVTTSLSCGTDHLILFRLS